MKHAIVYVPGLGDHRSGTQSVVVKLWSLYGVKTKLIRMNWRQTEDFSIKLSRLLKQVDSLSDAGYLVSLVGVSAGANAVVNAYAMRPDTIHRVVCICGKLRNKASMDSKTFRLHPGFDGSLDLLPESLASLNDSRRAHILSIRPLSDGRVPPEDTIIEGAQYEVIPTHGHVRSIALAITIYSWITIRFIKTKNEYAEVGHP